MFRSLLILSGALLIGCGSTLETGYRPNKLNSSQAERRAFYADEFSPESRPQDSQRGSGFRPR